MKTQSQLQSVGAMFCFTTLDGNKVYVDPDHVAFVEQLGQSAKIGFSGGATLTVQDEMRGTHEIIRKYKQGEQE